MALLSRNAKVNVLVGNGHFLSHFYILTLPPLFLFIQKDFDVSYAELGLVPVATSAGCRNVCRATDLNEPKSFQRFCLGSSPNPSDCPIGVRYTRRRTDAAAGPSRPRVSSLTPAAFRYLIPWASSRI